MIKWCIIGAGGIADRRTIPAILKDKDSALVALMDKNKAVAEKLGGKYGVPFFDSEEDMLSSVDCDAVYIGTPVSCHFEQASIALKYGKHVFVEKPISLSAEEGKTLLEQFKQAGRQLTVGYMMKYHNLHVKAKRIVEEGGIGQPVNVRAQFSCWYPDIPGAWRQNKRLGGGGAVMDLGVHCFELIEYILNDEIAEVKSFISTSTFNYEVEDSGIVVFRTKNGVLGHVDVNFNVPDNACESKLELYGTKGYAICKGTLAQEEKGKLSHLFSPQGDYVAMQNRQVSKPRNYYGRGGDLYMKQIVEFCNIIKNGEPDYSYAEKAVHIQEIVDKIYGN